jgi:hypothetical protein
VRFFQKPQRTLVPREILEKLAPYGDAVLTARRATKPLTDPRFDFSNFIWPVHTTLMSGDRGRVIEELYDAATTDTQQRELATVGAYSLLAEFNDQLDDRRFLKLYDASLEYMRSLGFSSGHLTLNERRRWVDTHGELRSSFDRLFEVRVPSTADAPSAKPLAPGETRMLASVAPPPDGNAFFAEHRPEGGFVVVFEGPKSVLDRQRVRLEETDMGVFETLPDLLRALGARLGTPPHWIDEDLEPYFPWRRA